MKNIICDIDGVLLHDNKLIPGSDKFIQRILAQGNPLVVLTNYPVQTGKDLQNRLSAAGIDIPEAWNFADVFQRIGWSYIFYRLAHILAVKINGMAQQLPVIFGRSK